MAEPVFVRRYVRHPLEAALAWLISSALRLMPVERASAFGGWLGRTIGPWTGAHKRSLRHIALAFPDKDATEIEMILRGMWDNLGRVIGEYPHIDAFRPFPENPRVEVAGVENFAAAKASDKGGIFFSAHFGNWELLTLSAHSFGIRISQIYRAPNNPYVDRLVQRLRGDVAHGHLPKGAAAARGMLAALRGGEHLAMLVDQKMNDGIAVPFFGRDAMTAPALAQLALRFDIPIYPARCDRLDGARFRITIFPPLQLQHTGDREADTRHAMQQVNQLFEEWITEKPDHWFWPHKRWP